MSITVQGEVTFDDGQEARNLERHLHKNYYSVRLPITRAKDFVGNGYTELFATNTYEMELRNVA